MAQHGQMRAKSRRVALAALLGALALLFLSLASFAPSGRVGLTAVAGLFPAAAVVSCGLSAGFLCYGGSALLALLLLSDKGLALLYLLFFGLYPMVKGLVERLRRFWIEVLLKLAFFNGILFLLIFGLSELVFAVFPVKGVSLSVVVLAGNLIFLAYDFGFSQFIGFYSARIDRRLRKS